MSELATAKVVIIITIIIMILFARHEQRHDIRVTFYQV